MVKMPADSSPQIDTQAQAAIWLARMQRPDAERYRSELDTWLGADPINLAAFNKASARFHDAKLLSRSDRWKAAPRRRTLPVHPWMLIAACIVMMGLAWPLWIMLSSNDRAITDRGPIASSKSLGGPRMLDNPHDRAVARRLSDGSTVTLDAKSQVRFAFTSKARDIWLDGGRARFSVAHDGRSFIVHAGGGTVTATGTLFDISLNRDGMVQVALIEGSVDVQPIAAASTMPRKLMAGNMIGFGPKAAASPITALDRIQARWIGGMQEFDGAPLSQIVAAANLYGSRPIIVQGDDLRSMPVSGRFRLDTPERLAVNLARILDLSVARNEAGALILHR